MTTAPPFELTNTGEAARQLLAAGYSITGATPSYVRHKPNETTIVAYRLATLDGGETWGYAHWCRRPDRADQIHHKATTLRLRESTIGPGLARLDDHTVFYSFPNDARLRRLRWYTDPRKIKRAFESLTAPGERISGSATSVTVLRYKPERRVVARVDLTTSRRQEALLVRYSTRRHADRLSGLAAHLRRHCVDTPAPVAQLDNNHVTVDQYVDGVQARHAIRAGTLDPAAMAAAIGRLHTTVPPATGRRTAAGDLERVRHGLAGLSTWHPDLAEPAQAVAAGLQQRLPVSNQQVLLHGDLHTKNMVVYDHRVIFVDLERVAVGPAAIDLGFLNAHAIALGVRRPGWSPWAADHARSVIDHYQLGHGILPVGALAWHTALGLAEQAVLVVRHLEGRWQRTSLQLLDLALRQLEPSLRRCRSKRR